MNVLVSYEKTELIVKKSRFIAEVFPISSQQEARDTLKSQKHTYADASHVVHAFFCGSQGQISGMSDDGEPSGTAGRPVLDVLRGRSITNILLTITRYFGGTLLGTGGLVRAYGESAKAILDCAQIEKLIAKKEFSYTIDYDRYEIVKRHITHLPITDTHEDFLSQVTVSGYIESESADILLTLIRDLTNGKVQVMLT